MCISALGTPLIFVDIFVATFVAPCSRDKDFDEGCHNKEGVSSGTDPFYVIRGPVPDVNSANGRESFHERISIDIFAQTEAARLAVLQGERTR